MSWIVDFNIMPLSFFATACLRVGSGADVVVAAVASKTQAVNQPVKRQETFQSSFDFGHYISVHWCF